MDMPRKERWSRAREKKKEELLITIKPTRLAGWLGG